MLIVGLLGLFSGTGVLFFLLKNNIKKYTTYQQSDFLNIIETEKQKTEELYNSILRSKKKMEFINIKIRTNHENIYDMEIKNKEKINKMKKELEHSYKKNYLEYMQKLDEEMFQKSLEQILLKENINNIDLLKQVDNFFAQMKHD